MPLSRKERNRISAARSRKRKRDELESAKQIAAKLTRENERLKEDVRRLEFALLIFAKKEFDANHL